MQGYFHSFYPPKTLELAVKTPAEISTASITTTANHLGRDFHNATIAIAMNTQAPITPQSM